MVVDYPTKSYVFAMYDDAIALKRLQKMSSGCCMGLSISVIRRDWMSSVCVFLDRRKLREDVTEVYRIMRGIDKCRL